MNIAAPLVARPRPMPGTGAVLGRMGTLTARLAATEAELHAAQRLRFDVFAAEFGAALDTAIGRDVDAFDAICDHLVVIDTALPGPDTARIVGTYRLLRQGADTRFYSDQTFDLAALIARHPDRHFLELGRSCVMPAYRGKRTLELLWQGIWSYCRRHDLDVMVGCASFAGTDPNTHRQALSFLHHHARAGGPWAVKARPAHQATVNLLDPHRIDLKAAMRALPPLIKGYMRLGASFGEGAVIDEQFSSIDVLVVLPVEQISARYLAHYGAEARRFSD